MIFHYTAINQEGIKSEADINAATLDAAIVLLQKKGLSVVDIKDKSDTSGDIFGSIFSSRKSSQRIW
jgi:type II secretory pathway component PulF